MKPISTAYNLLAAVAFVILAAGCASNNLLDKENVAVAAGFKVITPSKPAQVALLLNTGLIEGQTASVSFQFLQQWKINGYQPTVSTDLAFSGLGSCFSVDLDYQPLLLVMTSVPSY